MGYKEKALIGPFKNRLSISISASDVDIIPHFMQRLFRFVNPEGPKVHSHVVTARKGNPKLLAKMNEAIASVLKKNKRAFERDFNQCFKTTRWIENPFVKGSKFELSSHFERAAAAFGMDWIRLMAQGFQESALNHDAKSPYGALGIMQVLPSTAEWLGAMSCREVEGNIHAGAKYMARLMKRYAKVPEITDENRFFFALGAYNAGPGRVREYRKRAPELGYDANQWFGNVERVAFREATAGAPRPVHLDLLGLSGEVIENNTIEDELILDSAFRCASAIRPEPEPSAVQAAAAILEKAERPVIVAGRGAVVSSAAPEVLALAERLAIPVATSNDGKGIIIDTHPMSVGVVGTYSCRCANQVVSEADLVVYIGCSVSDQVTLDWRIPAPGTRVIQIDIDPCQLGRSYGNTLGIMGDAKVALANLISCLDTAKSHEGWTARVKDIVKEWKDLIEPMRNSDAVPIRPERLCRSITKILPSNAVLVSDTGYSAVWSSTMIHITNPDQRYIRAAGSLG